MNFNIYKKRKNYVLNFLRKRITKITKLTLFYNKVKMAILFGYGKLLPKNIL
jgi:hypothetical protein